MEAISNSYEAVTSGSRLKPWDGYWIKTKVANVTFTIPAAVGEGTATPKISDYLKPPVFRSPALLVEETKKASQFNFCLELFSKNASDKATIFGTHKDAREGYDFLDSKEPPIIAQTVAGYFEHPEWNEDDNQYNIDY